MRSSYLNYFFSLLLLLVILSIFIPFSPKMPAAGIDASWALALNQAVLQQLSFGKDILFTLGPYSAIYTKTYHPQLDLLILNASLYLAIAYWSGLQRLHKGFDWHWLFIFSVFFYMMLYSRDVLFFSYPLLIGLLCIRISFQEKKELLFLSFLFSPFGLFALIKSSLLVLSSTIALVSSLFFFINNKKLGALISITSPLFSCIFFWSLIGQKFIDLPLYLFHTVTMVGSFTEAMSLDGNPQELIMYAINSLILLLIITWQKQYTGSRKLFLLAIFFAFLFIAFKTGFTRHHGHALIPANAILIASLFLALLFRSKAIYGLLLLSLICWYFINSHYNSISLYKNFLSTYSTTRHGINTRLYHPHSLAQDFALSMDLLKTQSHIPKLTGTSDIYSFNQSYLIASENTWWPRPVFQSYSVFNAQLSEHNQNHLRDKNRPDHLIFNIEAIDNRFPALEDGASWPLILTYYRPTALNNEFLLLDKKEMEPKSFAPPAMNSKYYSLGEHVTLPDTNAPIYTEIFLKPTLWGRLLNLFYKPSPLTIQCTLTDGTQTQHRFIPAMAQAGFIISPLIESTIEFTLLYSHKNELKDKKVQSFLIDSNEKNTWQWQTQYLVRIGTVPTEKWIPASAGMTRWRQGKKLRNPGLKFPLPLGEGPIGAKGDPFWH